MFGRFGRFCRCGMFGRFWLLPTIPMPPTKPTKPTKITPAHTYLFPSLQSTLALYLCSFIPPSSKNLRFW